MLGGNFTEVWQQSQRQTMFVILRRAVTHTRNPHKLVPSMEALWKSSGRQLFYKCNLCDAGFFNTSFKLTSGWAGLSVTPHGSSVLEDLSTTKRTQGSFSGSFASGVSGPICSDVPLSKASLLWMWITYRKLINDKNKKEPGLNKTPWCKHWSDVSQELLAAPVSFSKCAGT